MPPEAKTPPSASPLFATWGGYVMAALGAFLFASKGIWIKLAYAYGIDAQALLTVRLLFATPVFILGGFMTWLSAKRRGVWNLPAITQRPGLYLKTLGVGALGYWLASYTDFESLTTLSPQFERLILFTYPLFVILFGAAFFAHPMRVKALWAFGIAYGGLMVVFLTDLKTHGSAIVTGALWCTASSLSFALYLLLAKPLIARLGPSMFTSWAMSGAAMVTFAHFLIVHRLSDIHMTAPLLALVIGLAVGATVLPSYLTNFALSRISSQANALISFINPVFTLILSGLFLRQAITPSDVIGTLMVIAGVGLYTWLDQRAARGVASRPTGAAS